MHSNYSLEAPRVETVSVCESCQQRVFFQVLPNQLNSKQQRVQNPAALEHGSRDWFTSNLPQVAFLETVPNHKCFLLNRCTASTQGPRTCQRCLDLTCKQTVLTQRHMKVLGNVINLIRTSNSHLHTNFRCDALACAFVRLPVSWGDNTIGMQKSTCNHPTLFGSKVSSTYL